MIVVSCSLAGSPGVSAWSMLLAAGWPDEDPRDRVVVEADVAGGVAAARYGLAMMPGLSELVTATRRMVPGEMVDLSQVGSRISERVVVVPAPVEGVTVARLWDGSQSLVAPVLAAEPSVWMVDVGRGGYRLRDLLSAASAVLVWTRPGREYLVQLPGVVSDFETSGISPTVCCVGRPDYPVDEIEGFVGAPVLTVSAGDPVEMSAAVFTSRKARRAVLFREAVQLAARVAEVTKERREVTL